MKWPWQRKEPAPVQQPREPHRLPRGAHLEHDTQEDEDVDVFTIGEGDCLDLPNPNEPDPD